MSVLQHQLLARWFTSYLSQRNQAVGIGSTLSDVLPLASGIRQGSILGPLLFIIYVNIYRQSRRSLHLIVMSMTPTCTCRLVYTITRTLFLLDLFRFRDWCFDNRLLINPEKTKLILYGSRQTTERLPQSHLSLLGKELVPTQ